MPIYEYECSDCRAPVELRLSISDRVSPCCPTCRGRNLKRVVSRTYMVQSNAARSKDLSWIDRSVARRLKGQATGSLPKDVEDTLDWMGRG